jgi:plastocyanin
MHARGLVALSLLTGCAAAAKPVPAAPAAAPTAAAPAAAPEHAHTPVTDRADALREAAGLLDKADQARARGNRSYAEQLFSSAELLVGPEALVAIAQVFREGAPPRVTTPLATLPLSTPPQPPAAAGDSQADEAGEKPRRGSLAGVLRIDGAVLKDQPAVITLEPADGHFRRRAPRQALMEQRGREFAPHILAVPTGSTVTFPNFDSIYHNVFSRSDTAPFDLGIYRSGQARSFVFDKDGIVHLGCNLHRNMSAYIVVVSQPHYVVSDGSGHFRFRSLEPGRYKARIWSERGEPTTRELTVAAGENNVTFDVHGRAGAEPDVDKFGVARGAR